MYPRNLFSALVLVFCLAACRDSDDPNPPETADFTAVFYNDFNATDAQFAVFLADESGAVRAFRWLPDNDSAQLTIPQAESGARFDCTVAKMTIVDAPGTGVRDTILNLTTYTAVSNGATFRLRDQNFVQITDVRLQLTNIQSLDSIIVPDGLTFALPQASNNFQGEYRITHTGRAWMRMLVNGDPAWRYHYIDPLQGADLDLPLDAAALPALPSPVSVALPLLTDWSYDLDGVLDTAARHFLALGDPMPVPGGAIPVFDQIAVYEPPALPFKGYRIRASGADPAPGGYGLVYDLFFDQLPAALPEPAFGILPTTLSDNRLVAVRCSGVFDLLAFARTNAGSPRLNWEVLIEPVQDGVVTYRLPDVPAELAGLFPALKNYSFTGSVLVRAEGYQQLDGFDEVLQKRMQAADPLWQAKAGYMARERTF